MKARAPTTLVFSVALLTSLDEVFEGHLKTATVFKRTSKTEQNELLESILAAIRGHIMEEVKSADFDAIQADETTHVSTQTQLVLVLRYIDSKHEVQERFFEFLPVVDTTSDSIASVLLDRTVFFPTMTKRNSSRKLMMESV